MNRSITRLLALAALAMPLVAGCSDDDGGDTTSDTGTATDTGGTGDAGGDTGGEDTGGGCATPLPTHADNTFRVVSIQIAKPAGKGEFLANLMNVDFEDQRLHILIDVNEFASECGQSAFRITGNAGDLVSEGLYTWFDGVEIEYKNASIDADGNITTDETLDLIFPAVQPNSDPPEIILIPVREIAIDGVIAQSASGLVVDATLTGAILLAEAQEVSIEIVPGSPSTIAELLGEGDMDYPAGAAEFTGWQLEAAIQAVPVAVDF